MIQLRVRTEYSFGATFATIPRIVERLKEMNVTAAGIVDFNSTWGHVPWFYACKEAGIQPLLGVDLVVSDNDETTRMWFLARTTAGLREMYEFTSKAHRQTVATRYGSVPRLYRDDVRAISSEVFVFSGDVVDEKFLLEVAATIDVNPSSRIFSEVKRRIAKKHELALVETSDNAFAFEEDKAAFEIASKAGTKVTPQHLVDVGDPDEAAAAIASLSDGIDLPRSPMIKVDGADEKIEELCRAGIKLRGFTKKTWTKTYEARLAYELDLIRSKDFESYFLIVADMVKYAKQHMLVGPSRGSSAGSLVCYLMQITEVDPIPAGLFFERFIDVTRTDLPDIDIDFPDNKRHLVFEYMAEKYGEANVAQIGTVSRYKPRSALIQVAKSLNIPASATASFKAALEGEDSLEEAFKTEAGQQLLAVYPYAEIATRLEEHANHTGVHAAGLLVSNEPVTNFATVDADGVAHLDKIDAERINLLKIDVLGLRTLAVLEDSGVVPPGGWYGMTFDDPATFEVFNSGRFCGIFQFEGGAMRATSKKIEFETLREVDAVTAIVRPGPMAAGVPDKFVDRHKGKQYAPIHPKIDALMEATYSLPVYQEQTLALVREIGRFSWEDTATVRKAISKSKGKEFLARFFEQFVAGAKAQGIPAEAAKKAWALITQMGAWQMNKAHTHSYAVVSYWTAWLKAHHPLEFAAASLRNSRNEETAVTLLREMVAEGFEYVAFDPDESDLNWTVRDGKLLGGFLSLKGIGEAGAKKYLEARAKGGLSDKDREELAQLPNAFTNLFPISTRYAEYYENPSAMGVSGDLVHIGDIEEGIPHKHERIFIGELTFKAQRDRNEEILVEKRGGKKETGQTAFADFAFLDDSGTIKGRVGKYDFERIGRAMLALPIGAHVLIRAKFFNGIRYAFVQKFKRLDV